MNTTSTRPRPRQSLRFSETTKSFAVLLVLLLTVAHDVLRSGRSSSPGIAFADAFQLTPSTPPDQVIEQQLAALKDGDIGTVYQFASPGNKAQTGDVTNFSEMVRSGPYRYLVGHSRSDVLLESKMAMSRQFLVRVTATIPDMASSPDFDDDDDDDDDDDGDELYGLLGESSKQNKSREKILEYWWSLSRCKTGEFSGSYMVDAVIPNQAM